MPLYEYECSQHGVFESMRPLAEYQAPLPCPECGSTAHRVVLTSAAVAGMPTNKRVAHERNELSAHQPRSNKDTSKSHGRGCSCCGNSGKKSNAQIGKDGSKAFPSKRPWMISH